MDKNEVSNVVLKEEKVKYVIKDEELEVTERYYIDVNTGERLYDREMSIENDRMAYDAYRKKKGLLTSTEIKRIRKKYNLTQKEYALAIGVGEITVHRFENGTIQTESIDAIMKLSEEPKNMLQLILKNKDKLEKNLLAKTVDIIIEQTKIEEHRIANINPTELTKLHFTSSEVKNVAAHIIMIYNQKVFLQKNQYQVEFSKITPLELQKFLYFVNGIALAFFGQPAFQESIVAWVHGPVVKEIYQHYKKYGRNGIETPQNKGRISAGLKKIIEEVVNSYGKYSGPELIRITHEEDPWQNTNRDDVIENDDIKAYFQKVYGVGEK